jgi:succinyl-CoA synthetase alpha subunit
MSKLDISLLRSLEPQIVCLGSYRGIIQSMLDFDFESGKTKPSVIAIVATGRRAERYFFGRREVVIPVVAELAALPERLRERANLVLNLSSGRRVLASSRQAVNMLPKLVGGTVFAEGMPERHALALEAEATDASVWMLGAASVGLVVPGVMKLGAIGGTEARQLRQSGLFTPGRVAVVSSSGGMVNEIIRMVARSGHTLSFGLALGGERFPMISPLEAFLAAESDPETEAIVYFGELGGRDEYKLAERMREGAITKPVVSYIAGSVAELFAVPLQFGHAKAIAGTEAETARVKAAVMRAAGARVARTFSEFVGLIGQIPGAGKATGQEAADGLSGRRPALVASSVSGDAEGSVRVLGQDLLSLAKRDSFAKITISMLLGRQIASAELEGFVDFVLRLLVDHGPYVSGAVNTIVAARAGRDLVSALASGLLTIGPRFGGAINQAAATWLLGVREGRSPAALVEDFASNKQYISGIGHRKYRSDEPDPRVQALLEHVSQLGLNRFTKFALGVETETTAKKRNLILNVDGAIAAVLLDLLSEKEGYTDVELQQLVDQEFFNALFVVSRSVGFMAHYFDQRRMDEGIFRLPADQVAQIDLPERD